MGDKIKGMLTSNSCEWETPQDLFDRLNRIFHFTLDVAANDENHKCEKYFTKEQDGLTQKWGGTAYGAIHLMAVKLANG